MFSNILASIVTSVLFIGAFFGLYSPPEVPANVATVEYVDEAVDNQLGTTLAVGGKVYKLKGSGVSGSQTTINLTKFEIAGGTQKLRMQDFGTLGCGTLDPGNNTKQEFVSFTGVTQNSDGTAQLTGVSRGLEPIFPYNASTTLQSSHSGGSRFVLSNSPPCFYESLANLTASSTISAIWQFGILPESTLSATSANQFTIKNYVDNVALQGAATSSDTQSGISERATRVEMASSTPFNANNPHYINSTNATSACQAIGLNVVVTENDGKIANNCLDLTESFTFTASTTFTAPTTTVERLDSLERDFSYGSFFGTYPTGHNASSTFLASDGGRNLYYVFPAWELLISTTTANVMDFATATIPASTDIRVFFEGTNESNGGGISVQFNGDAAGNYGYKQILFNNANTVLAVSVTEASLIALTRATTSPTGTYHVEFSLEGVAAGAKYIHATAATFGSGAIPPSVDTVSAIWNNTSDPVTSVVFRAFLLTDQIASGARIVIYGRRE